MLHILFIGAREVVGSKSEVQRRSNGVVGGGGARKALYTWGRRERLKTSSFRETTMIDILYLCFYDPRSLAPRDFTTDTERVLKTGCRRSCNLLERFRASEIVLACVRPPIPCYPSAHIRLNPLPDYHSTSRSNIAFTHKLLFSN